MILCCCGGNNTPPVGGIPGCFCQNIPTTLRMTSFDPTCNFQMFQSCNLVYQPVPPDFQPTQIGDYAYLSYPVGFPDPIAGGAIFYYYLTCEYNQFTLTRIYLKSPYGSPFRDAILYSWLVGSYANSCDPLHLDNGTAFPGSDASCNVHIDAP